MSLPPPWPRLNWGCGPVLPEGWTNSDVTHWGPGQQHLGDIRSRFPWAEHVFDYVVSAHALQMLAWPELIPALAELRRVTRPGGWLRLSVPDVAAAVHAWRSFHPDHFQISDDHEISLDGKLCLYLTQAGSTRSVFTGPWLCELLARAGWRAPTITPYGKTASPFEEIVAIDNREAESVFVEARR